MSTNGALLAQYQSYATSAPFIPSAFTDNGSNADLLQIANGAGTVVLAVRNNGTVNFNANGLTAVFGSSQAGSYTYNRQVIGLFRTRQTDSSSITTAAQAVASAFPLNPQNLDIIQVIAEGGNVGYSLTSAGVAVGS